ncbi:hypothetical protein Dsin_028473 [Dipteronia sinensis]|uniref:Uncharacterized protein n=1 Tax=Dipteronia sinensis TaxID=43782 RepID=A0AAD9ZQW6_9ROSI|nr:hypothetical protein Dsin_028473 [Dipteronia sinensis]
MKTVFSLKDFRNFYGGANINEYMPQVKPECKPKLDQEFALIDDVHEFYNQYAKEACFSVRTNSSRKNKDTDEIVSSEYVIITKIIVPTISRCEYTYMATGNVKKIITHCFWAVAKSRRAYKYFGDVVVFDSTYNTNRYGRLYGNCREELIVDHVDINEKLVLKMPNMIEKQMSETYTH